MDETTSTDGAKTTTSGTPQMGTPATDGQTPVSQATTEEKSEAYLAQLRKENATIRKRLEAFEKAQADADAAKLTETERQAKELADITQRNEDLAAELMEARVHQDIARHAGKYNFQLTPDLIAKLLEWKDIEWDEESGRPNNVDKLLGELAKSAPNLVGRGAPAPSSGGATNPPRSSAGGFSQITRDNLAEAMANYDKLAPAQQREVTRLLTGR